MTRDFSQVSLCKYIAVDIRIPSLRDVLFELLATIKKNMKNNEPLSLTKRLFKTEIMIISILLM